MNNFNISEDMSAPVISAEEAVKVIPQGMYCYAHTGQMIKRQINDAPADQVASMPEIKLCPYWERRSDKPAQQNGYCQFLRSGDWMPEGTMLLWDQVKECGVNSADDD